MGESAQPETCKRVRGAHPLKLTFAGEKRAPQGAGRFHGEYPLASPKEGPRRGHFRLRNERFQNLAPTSPSDLLRRNVLAQTDEGTLS